jgi:hypothetical protein
MLFFFFFDAGVNKFGNITFVLPACAMEGSRAKPFDFFGGVWV